MRGDRAAAGWREGSRKSPVRRSSCPGHLRPRTARGRAGPEIDVGEEVLNNRQRKNRVSGSGGPISPPPGPKARRFLPPSLPRPRRGTPRGIWHTSRFGRQSPHRSPSPTGPARRGCSSAPTDRMPLPGKPPGGTADERNVPYVKFNCPRAAMSNRIGSPGKTKKALASGPDQLSFVVA